MKKIICSKPKVLIKSGTILGEGPIWNYKTSELTFVDIISGKFFIWEKKILKSFNLPYKISCLLPYKDKGNWIATSKNKILKISIKHKKIKSKVIRTIKEPKQNRFNDGKCDYLGRLWLSSMDSQEKVPSGQLWFLKSLAKPKIMDKKFIIGNGIDWSPNNKILYFAASDKRIIYSYFFNIKTGKLSNKKIIIKTPKKRGYPDGICTDSQGFIWVAYWDGSCVIRHSANGKIDKVIKLPIKRPTSLSFGGKNLNLLFITSAKTFNKKNHKTEKNSGNVFVVKTNVKGKKINFYKD
jgi:sugar lactone lactonase YvrE